MSERLGIYFGALASPVKKQLAGRGCKPSDIAHWQKDSDAIVRLALRGLIPDHVARTARQRIIAAVAKDIRSRQPAGEPQEEQKS